MLRTRLWMGGLMIAGMVGVLTVDPAPWFPLFFVLALAATWAACLELANLLPRLQPRKWVLLLGISLIVLANWLPHLTRLEGIWEWIGLGLGSGVMLAFLVEGRLYTTQGGVTARLSVTVLAFLYIGLLGSFLLQLRWLEGTKGAIALGMAIFVPKCSDIGAYFIGRFFGRHKSAPVLSPKKTWEGVFGGLAFSVIAAIAVNAWSNQLLEATLLPWTGAVLFGLLVGIFGQLGDLMESMIKRDCESKDSSQAVPGFGGVLDVLDSILFSAPVAFVCIRLTTRS